MKKIIQKDIALRRQEHVIFSPSSTKPAYSNIQIYNSHQVWLFDFSCNKCVNKKYCSEPEQKCTHCEIDDAIIKSHWRSASLILPSRTGAGSFTV